MPLHANRGNGRTYTDADRRRSHETSTYGRLTNGHLFANPLFHHLDGRDPAVDQKHLFITLARKPLGDDAAGKTGADYEPIKHGRLPGQMPVQAPPRAV